MMQFSSKEIWCYCIILIIWIVHIIASKLDELKTNLHKAQRYMTIVTPKMFFLMDQDFNLSTDKKNRCDHILGLKDDSLLVVKGHLYCDASCITVKVYWVAVKA